MGTRARSSSLTREDLESGTFTVSNLGMYGISEFQAIINPPQVAILALGVCEERLVPVAEAVQKYLGTLPQAPESMFDTLYEKLPGALQEQRQFVANRSNNNA